MTEQILCTAFAGVRRLASGALPDVAITVKAALAADPARPVVVFSDATGAVIDLDLRGSEAEVRARLEPPAETDLPSRGRGRPKLGVVAREVTLLPRHWDWLAAQSGGASQALRRLIDQARRADDGRTEIRLRQETAYRFLCVLAGNLPGFEEAARALFANDRARFLEQTAAWPLDVCDHAQKLAWPGYDGDMSAIFTIGHSNQTAEQFVGLLQRHDIRLLADVRSSPASRFAPQFNRAALARSLEQAGIGYRWFGQALGGKPRAPEPVFSAGIADLLQVAETQSTAIMCAERDPRMCHRTHLVTPALLKNGAIIAHILGDGTLLAHDALQQPAKQPDLFG